MRTHQFSVVLCSSPLPYSRRVVMSLYGLLTITPRLYVGGILSVNTARVNCGNIKILTTRLFAGRVFRPMSQHMSQLCKQT